MKQLRAHRTIIHCLMIALLAFWQIGQPLQAATFYWDADEDATGNDTTTGGGLGGTGTWDTSTQNWWDGSASEDEEWPDGNDIAIFSGPFPLSPYAVRVLNTVTLTGLINANQLRFQRSGYTLTGGTLALAGSNAGIHVETGETATIASVIDGTDGLLKTGGGAVRLSGVNTYTGTTTISNGTLIISDANALGADSSAIVITESNATPTNLTTIGFPGGTLLLDGSAGGVNLARNINVQGNGAIGRGAAIVSVGNNTLSGVVSSALGALSPNTFRNTRITSANGTLTFSGTLNAGGTAGTTVTTLGGINSTGVGNYNLTGTLSGTGYLEKAGAGTLFFNPSDSSGFSGRLRISASATGGQSSVRITSVTDGFGNNIFGTANATGSSATIDLNAGTLEIRSDSSLNFGRNVYTRSTGIIYTGPAAGGAGVNGTTTFGTLQHVISTTAATATTTFNSRNGYGVTFSSMAMDASTSTSALINTLTNNMGGNLTFTGNITLGEGNTASRPRTLAVGGGGNTVIQGSVIAGTDPEKSLTKSGVGNLTILGTGTTVAGPVSINGGAITITDFRSLNNNTATINIGSTTTAGALIVGSSVTPTLAGLTTSKTINLAGTTGGAGIYANQTGANPITLNANFTATGAGTKTLTLGGSNEANNIINGAIVQNSGANITILRKNGAGTWVLAGANTYTGSTQITNGTLKIQDTFSGSSRNVLSNASAIGFVADVANLGTAGGIFQYLGAAGSASSETVGPLMLAAGAGTVIVEAGLGGTADLTFASIGTSQTTTAASSASTTITVGSTSGLVPGMRLNGGSAAATISSITNGTQIVVSAAQTIAASTLLTFDRPNGGATVNFDPGVGSNIIIGTVPAIGFVNSYSHFQGADFAYAPATSNATLRAPVYDADAGFVTAGAALSLNNHNLVTGNTSTGVGTVLSLKIAGNQTVTQTALLTIRQGAAGTSGGILVTGGNATITGTGVTTGGAADLIIRVNGESDVLNLNAPITSTTTGGFTKSGAGTLILSGLNAQTGTTTINEGTVQLAGSGSLSANSVALIIRQDAILDLNGFTTDTGATSADISSFNGTGTVTSSSAAAVLFAVGGGTTGGTGTWNGTINETNGQISVIKKGTSNSQTWNGISNYTGSTTIGVAGTGTTGSLTVATLANIGSDSSIGRGNSSGEDQSEMDANNAASLIFGGTTGGLIYTGNVFDGDLVVNTVSASTNRLFTIAGTGATLSSNVTNNNAIVWSNNTGAIVFQGAGVKAFRLGGTSTGDNTFNPQITNNGADATTLTKIDAGQWNLGNSNNTYTGATTITNGILALNDNGAIHDDSPIVLNPASATSPAILQMSGTFDRDLSATPMAGTGSITWGWTINSTTGGAGFAAHADELVVAIGGTDTPTALTWGSGGFVGTGGVQNLVLGSTTALSYVDFRNAIDLGNAQRTVNVLDNTSTGADFAILSGVLGGTGGSLRKIGTGSLRLTGANTYTGVTSVEAAGTLVVTSLGHSGVAGGSSLGASGVTMDNSNALTLGNAGTTAGILQYVGAGEVSDRKIRLNTTTGATQIHADGTGAIILTNVVNDMVEGNKVINLRGSNMQGNMIISDLSNNGSTTLGITVDGAATWILAGDSTYTGTTTISSGALGIGHNNALGTGTVNSSNGVMFAYGQDRTITNNFLQSNTTTAVAATFIGDYSLTLDGATWTHTMTTVGHTLTNNIVAGQALIVNSAMVFNAITANRTLTVEGNGTTILNGDFTSTTLFGVGILKNGNGTLVLGGTVLNAGGANIDVDRGTLRMGADNVILSVAGSGGLILSPEGVDGDIATLDFNGTTQTVNALTSTTNGTVILDNTSDTDATFRFGANDSAINFGSGVGTYSILNTGAGALSLVKLGNTTATFISGITLAHQGITASEGGGVFNIASAVTATTGLRAIEGSALNLSGGLPNGSLVTSIEVGGGSTLSLLDGAGSQFSNLTTLSLGNTGSGTVTLNLNIGDKITNTDRLQTDTLTLLTGGTLNLGQTITFNLTDAGLNANQTYTLLNLIDGGITTFGAGNIIQGATPGGFDSFTWNVTNNLVQLTTGNLLLNDLYWRGSTDNTWNANVNNWSLLKNGTGPDPDSIPGQGNEVIFAWDDPGSGALTTTLEQNFKINSLVFEAGGTTTPSSVTIAPGALATARLEIAPQDDADGITLAAGGPSAVTISANLRLGANQTWNVADAASTLTLSGALFGEANVTKSGDGKVILTGAADPTFNGGPTSVFTVTGGNLEFTNTAAFGTSANSNVASIVVSGGGFYYNNATAGTALTLPHSITLNGGALSGGGATHVYGGTVNVAGASTINLVDSNGPVTNTARSITLAGVVSGSGSLTIDSNNTASSGNQLGGTLTINNAASTWNGDLLFNRGTVTITAAASAGVLPDDITFNSFGRYIVQGVDGQTINRAGTLIYAAGAVGEFQVDNTTTTQITDFLINQNGAVTLGSGGTGATMRVALVDTLAKLNITGGVTLGGDSSISVSNNAARLLTISSVINDGGSGYSLAINDDAGAWAQTNGIVRLTALNTFTGNISVSDGILEFDTVTNISGGASSLGNGTAISMAGGTLRFIGSASQSTNRAITTTGSATLSANGTLGAIMTYNGSISQAANNTLTLAGTGEGVITGGITQPAGAASADLSVTGGTWTIQDNNVNIADDLLMTGGTLTLKDMVFTLNDDVVVTGTGAVLNLNTTGVLIANNIAGTSSGLHARTGGVINLGANAIFGVANSGGLDFINVGDSGAGAAGVFNTNTFNITSPGLLVGGVADGLEGNVTGTGTITVTSTAVDWSLGIRAHRGSISANLAGVASLLKQGLGEMTLSGNNSGLSGTVAATRLDAGSLVLDYTTQNNNKISAAAALDMRGASLTLNGNNSAATSQSVTSFTLASGGANTISINNGTGQTTTLNLGAITRAASAGTLRINVSSASSFVTTSTALTNGLAGLSGFLTVKDSAGTWFATKSGSNIVGMASVVKNDVSTWVVGDHVTNDGAGFTGALNNASVNSLRFDAAGGSEVTINTGRFLNIASGGILVTDQVTAGTPGIFGGNLVSGVAELIITQDSSQAFEISSTISFANALTKTGIGTLVLSGNNNSTGQVLVQAGTLELAGGRAIGDTTLITLADDQPTTLRLLASEVIGRIAGGSATSGLATLAVVDIGSHKLTLNQTANSTYAGMLAGSGTLIKTGANNFQLTNASAGFTGEIVVNQGLLYFTTAGTSNATAIMVNKSGTFMMDKDGTTAPSGNQVLDTATITLNSADGTFSGETIVRGLSIRNNNASTRNETVGVITLNSGASYATVQGTIASAITAIIADNIVRANNATLNVRGVNMQNTANQRGQLRIGTAGNQTAFISAMIGGGSTTLGTKNISIVPWAIAENTTAAIADVNMGNSLATYVSGQGFRALDLTTEYNTYATAGVTDNTRESLAADLTGLSGKTINSLVINNNNTTSINVTGSGAGQTLTNTSGAFLFTLTNGVASTGYGTILGGFNNGITVGGTNEYVFHVVNPSSAATTPTLTATVSSPLTSTADITKSGRGALILSGSNTAGGGAKKTTINEGILEISDLDNIGGNTGGLVFAGGTLRLGAGLADDITLRTITFLNGGGGIDTNNSDFTLAGSLGSGLGGFTKVGLGSLTLTAAATYTGATTVSGGRLVLAGGNDRLATVTGLVMGGGTLQLGNGGGTSDQAVSALSGTGSIVGGNATVSTLTVNQVLTSTFNGILGGVGVEENNIALVKTGEGTLTLGAASTFTGGLTIKAGVLITVNVANALGDNANVVTLGDTTGSTNATLNVQNTQTYANAINVAAGSSGVLSILGGLTTGAPTLSGAITLNNNLTIGKLGTTGAFTLSGGITGTGNIIIANTGTTGVITLTTTEINHAGSITNSGFATATTTISADIGANVTSIIQNSATSALTLSGANIAFTGALVVSSGTLNLTGGATTGPTPNALTVAGGGTLNLVNTVGQIFDLGAGTINLGAGTGTAILGLELGSTSDYDGFTTTGAATTANNVVFNLTALSGFGAGTYDLLTAGGGLNNATYGIMPLSAAFVGQTLSLNTSATLVQLVVAASTGAFHWNGGVDTSWVGTNGLSTNWTSDLAGTLNIRGTPGAASSVIFTTSTQTGTALATTLGAAFSIQDLTFNNQLGTGPLATISIAPGTGGSLTITPTVASAGINVQSGAAASITLSAPITLGANQTWTVAAGSTLISSGIISGTANLTKAGDGTLTLSGAHTYNGTTTVSAGILQAGAANGFNQTSAHIVEAGAILRLNNVAAVIGSLAGAGTVEVGPSGTAARILTVGGDNTSTLFSGVLQNGGSFGLGLTKIGTGTLTLSGSNTFSGATIVRTGVLAISGSTNTSAGSIVVGDNAGARGRLVISAGGDLLSTDIDFGSNATGAGAGYQTGGTVTITGADATNRFTLGNVAGGYGYYELSGGTLNTFRLTAAGNSFAGATGVFVQTGGTMNVSTWSVIGHGSGNALVDISGGTYNAAGSFALNHVSNAYSVVNVRDTGVINRTAGSISLMQGNASSVGNVGIINLMAGGTIRTNSGGIVVGAGTSSSGNISLLNFNGGTIVTNAVSTTLVGSFNNAAHTASSGAYIYSGGLTIDTNGLNSTLPAALLAPGGEGVATIAVTDAGSGYIGAPLIKITGGTGVGATAIANMVDDGTGNGTFKIDSITITNPGTGYVNTDVLTLAFGDNSGAYTTQAVLGAVAFNGGNTSGGLTKTGVGTLTLSGANTYTGGTTITGGALALGVSNALADAGNVTINGGIFNIATFSDTVAVVSLQDGSITGTTGVLTSTADYDLRNGAVSAILAGGVGVSKTTAGTVVLSGGNTFSGAVGISGGSLQFSGVSHLGGGGAGNVININGGTLDYTGSGQLVLGSNRVITIGAGGATLAASNSLGSMTVNAAVNGSSGGDLTKTGSGAVIISSGSVDLNGGSVTVADGRLSAGFTAAGVSDVTVSSTGTLHLADNAAVTLALGSGALNLADGARLGLELGASGVSDMITLTGAATVAGTITLDFFNLGALEAGTYNLLQAGSGLDNASYVLGNAPTGFNYTINVSGTLVSLDTTVLIARYWTGLLDSSWSTVNAGPTTNWSSTADGMTDAQAVPGAAHTVIFSAANATGPSITTTLDGAFIIDSLQFLNVPSGVTAVTINPGTGGSLSITPASSTNGILVAANGGAVTIAAPLTIGAAQTWNVNGTGVSSLAVTGDVTFTNLVTKTGAGVLTLSGANSGAGGLTLTGGALNLNSTTALGTGTFTIGAGTTLNNSTAGALTLSTDNLQNWNGSFTFTGTQNLNLGAGLVTLGGNATVSVLANTLTVGGSISDGLNAFSLTKDGAGTLTINGSSNQIDGGLTIILGTFNLDNGSSALGALTVTGGTASLNGANTVAGAVTISGGTTTMNGGNTLNGGVAVTAGTLTMNGGNSITGALTNNGGVVTLGGANSISTGAAITSGTLNINHAGSLGSQTFTINGGTINNTSGGAIALSTNNAMAWNGSFTFTGANALNLGAGAVTLGNSTSVTVSASTLTVGGVIDDGVNAFSLTKLGNGTLTLNGQSTYDGATIIQTGTVILGVDDALPTDTQLTVGAGTTAATLNLGAFSQSVAALSATANTASVSSIVIASGETLTVNGNFSLNNNTDNAQTHLTMSGGGALVVNGALFTVGNNTTGTNNSSWANLNLSALSSFTATLSGNLTVQLTGDLDTAHLSSLILSNTANTITAVAVTVGASASGGVQSLILGAGTNVINASTINLGTGGRDGGSVTFGGNATGTLVIRNTAGLGRAAFNMGTGTATTGGVTSNTFDVTGHDADLLFGAVNIGTQAARTGALTNVFSFDQGVLDMTSLTMGNKTAAGNSTNTLSLGGGTVIIGTTTGTAATLASNTSTGVVSSTINVTGGTVTIGGTGTGQALIMGNSNTSTGSTFSALNVSGGSVTLATTGATAVTMANAAAGTATAAITVSGTGTLTVQGNIVSGTGAGTRDATVTLNGGTLNMSGKNIGAAGNTVIFNAESGVLQNLSQLNGGGDLTKTTTGLLVMQGANTYTGATNVNEGILQVGAAGAGSSGIGVVTVASGATLAGSGTINGSSTIIGGGAALQAGDVLTPGTTVTTVTEHGTLTFTAANNALTVDDGGQIRLGVSIPTISATISFENGELIFNGNNYATAKELFDTEAAALSAWNVAPADVSNHDFINLTGANSSVTLGSRASGTFGDGTVLVTGFSNAQLGQVFNLLDWQAAGTISGGFTTGGSSVYDASTNVIAGDLDLGALGAGFGWDVSAFSQYGIIVVVPEPSRALFLMLGLLGLMLRRWRR